MSYYKVKELTQVITIQVTRIGQMSEFGAADIEAGFAKKGIRMGVDERDLENIKELLCVDDVSVASNQLFIREVDE